MKFYPAALVITATLVTPVLAVIHQDYILNHSRVPSVGLIIELEFDESITGRSIGEDTHSAFHRQAETLTNYSVRHEFKIPEYFYGVSINAEDDTNIDSLLALPQVKRIWPNRYYERPMPVEAKKAAHSPGLSKIAGTNPVQQREAAQVVTINGTADVLSSLRMTGADKVHALGITGKGIKIGVVDSGVDWRHPALGGGFGTGFKIAGGYDLVGDAFEGWNDPVPDDNPLTTCLEGGHGTHVAGILAARDPAGVGFGIVGVAPDALLYAYRVLGCTGGVTDDVLMQGLVKAASDGVDVISMSIGIAAYWEKGSPYTPILARIRSQGIAVIAAAGNDGASGLYYSSAPAQNPNAWSIGSVNGFHFPTVYNAAGSDGSNIGYGRVVPLSSSVHFHVFVADDHNGICVDQAWADAIKSFPEKANVIALVTDGSDCYYNIMFERSNSSGFKNIWSWLPETKDMTIDEPGTNGDIDVVKLKKSEADKILAGIAKEGNSFTLSFEDQNVHQIDQPTGGTISWFSSFGPTMEMSLKPQVSAPGGTILSTWVTSNGWGYAVVSGTSMATPHVAGGYALMKQKFPSLNPEEIMRRLQSSAKPLIQYESGDILTTAAQQGSGLLNILRAITCDTVFSTTEFNLYDTARSIERNFTIENLSSSPKTYLLGHKPAAEVNGLPRVGKQDVEEMFSWKLNFNAIYAKVTFPMNSITISAGGREKVKFTITPPIVDPALLPTYSGFITVNDGNDEFSIPYLGIPYNRSSIPNNIYVGNVKNLEAKLQPPPGVPKLPYVTSTDTGIRIKDRGVFTFPAKQPPENQTQGSDNDPIIVVFIDQPSAYVRLDAVPVDLASNNAYNFTPSTFGYIPGTYSNTTVTYPSLDLKLLDNFAGVMSYGLIHSLYGSDMPQADFSGLFPGYGIYGTEWTWGTVELANGTKYQLPNADYRVLIRALRWGGNLTKANDYDSWLSPIISVNIADPGYPNPWISS